LETAKVDNLCSYSMQCLRKWQLIKLKTANYRTKHDSDGHYSWTRKNKGWLISNYNIINYNYPLHCLIS